MSKKIQTSSIGYRIVKKDSSDDETYSETSHNEYSDENKLNYRFNSIIDSNYKKPKEGSKQENMTKEEIREKLDGYKALRTIQDKKILLTLKPFKVWIRYFNTQTKEFRIGGLLKLVDPELRYIILFNINKNLTWSVQLKDNIIFIPNDLESKEREKEKEKNTKEKLYELYKKGKLIKK